MKGVRTLTSSALRTSAIGSAGLGGVAHPIRHAMNALALAGEGRKDTRQDDKPNITQGSLPEMRKASIAEEAIRSNLD